ncbi:MAG: uracil-DNA glycosylase, partial [Muribaculaceae bacterium]|nr:uracil-DNA glycosylase [Muribaculaceae bacterium]
MNVRIEEGWKKALAAEWEAPYFAQLTNFVSDRYRQATIYPPGNRIFAAFDSCPFDKVKVVILGQDPYHGPGQANGLCFSVNPGIAMPPSLLNIFKEIHADTGAPIPPDGDLSRWAAQGVLLLNATLTVEAHLAGSHQGKGWETFTDHAIEALSRHRDHIVFILWGSYAKSKSPLIDPSRHRVRTS